MNERNLIPAVVFSQSYVQKNPTDPTSIAASSPVAQKLLLTTERKQIKAILKDVKLSFFCSTTFPLQIRAGSGSSTILETKKVLPIKAPFLSLNLNALAGQLAKAKLSKRCFLDPDLFPLELLNTEYGGLKKVAMESSAHMAAAKNQIQQISTPSNVLALPGPELTNDMQKAGLQKDLVISSTGQPKGPIDVGVQGRSTAIVSGHVSSERNLSTSAIMERIPSRWPRPVWHAPWKNYRVISGHLGWVRSVAVDPSNTWFCTGSADRTIKIWDLASGRLRLTLTGHIDQVRGLAISSKHTYMFSAGDDKLVKCWDLEQNKAIRSYHGHLSGVYCLALHPTIDILLTGGRDSVCRVWDIRSKMQIHALSGHENTVCSVFTRPTDPQVITGSHDSTIKLWDLRYGKTMATLTHHKKSVRAMAPHPTEDCFVSASAENIKKFKLPKGEFMHNMLSPQKTIINAAAVNEEGVLATAGDNGSLWFWDWKSGHNFQQAQTIVQPGSLDSEAGIYAITYDLTGSRLITCEADKTIKMWKEDDMATPETHPLHFKPPKDMRRF